MRLFVSLLPLVLLLAACAAEESNMPKKAQAPETREILCHRTDTPPAIDGDLSDPAWRRATPIATFYQLGGGDQPAQIESVALMLYDDEYLYIGVLMRKHHDASVSDGLWRDNVEIFLDPNRTKSRYYQLAVNHRNSFSARPVRDATWNPDLKHAGRELPYGWSLEIALPLTSLEAPAPKAGHHWRGNICRTDSMHGYSTAALLHGGSGFHAPGAFLAIRFTDEPAAIDEAQSRKIREAAKTVHDAFERQVAAKAQTIAALNDRHSATLLQAKLSKHTERAAGVLDPGQDDSPFADLGRYWLLSSLLGDMAENLAWEVKTANLFE